MNTSNQPPTLYLSACALNGDISGVREHISQSSQHERDSALASAAHSGHLDIVRCLLEHGANPHHSNSMALTHAAAMGHSDIVETLLPVSDLKANNTDALSSAAFRGRVDCLRLLLLFMDAKTNNHHTLTEALRGARIFSTPDHQACVDILLPLSDLAVFLKTFENTPLVWRMYHNMWGPLIAQQQANKLSAVVKEGQRTAHKKI